ncbi:helix-turn-helix domain-containing protein [Halobacterium salinarum]|uniref:winged helix-turn-helix domain-containing protein n=1 Tax=Halobacterium salinarum TaxID=2242 RepID=UPI001F23A285|nr:winged helix-turn-helix domain-containing protein [Halobacterium salinarum]MCF2208297.1 helix-turn-helix domain-containing protein [Halobacterium salinarum]
MSGSEQSPDPDTPQSASSATQDDDGLAAADAFALLGNETRIDILQALWRAPERPVSFSALRKRVGMRDSAQFNYHLSKLTDHFVRSTDDGYEFQYAGEKVVRAILAGTFTDRVSLSVPITGTCFACGETLVGQYADERLSVECAACATTYARYAFPPGGLRNRSDAEVAAAFDQRIRHLHCLAADGVCPECGGRMTTTLTPDDDSRLDLNVRVDHTCQQCQHTLSSPVGLSLLDDATVVAFHADHGIDVTSTPHWTLGWCVTDDTTAYDPDRDRATVTIRLDDESLTVTLDGSLSVVDTTRA